MQSTRSSFETLINLQFAQHIFEKQSKISGFIKIRPVGAELFHVDRQTDVQTGITKLIGAFRSFTYAPNNQSGTLKILIPTTLIRQLLVKTKYLATRLCLPGWFLRTCIHTCLSTFRILSKIKRQIRFKIQNAAQLILGIGTNPLSSQHSQAPAVTGRHIVRFRYNE
jgi:hypothetical protein